MKSIINNFWILFILILSGSCKKLVEVEIPITNNNGELVFRDDNSANAVLIGIYSNMSTTSVTDINGRLTSVFFTTGLTSDELKLYDPNNAEFGGFFSNNISPQFNTWDNIYNMILVANSAITELPKGEALTPAVKSQLLGEAHFVRAFCYFYLVNLYGRVPMPVTTDYKINRVLPRSDTSDVYDLIVSDLKEAQGMLAENYVGGDAVTNTTERVRPNKWVATALLARVYLYRGDNVNAEIEATSVINNSLFNLVELNSAFLKNNREAIWQLQPLGRDFTANTPEGRLLKLLSPPADFSPVSLQEGLLNSFEANDQRKDKWIAVFELKDENGNLQASFPYANKYKIGNESFASTEEYSTVMRLAEQFLIRAEARIKLNKIGDGIDDLNELRKRADPSGTLPLLSTGLSNDQALVALENERRHELFTEWGHRWFDLVRTKGFNDHTKTRADEVLGIFKGSNWQSTDILFPIQNSSVNGENPGMTGDQNPGY